MYYKSVLSFCLIQFTFTIGELFSLKAKYIQIVQQRLIFGGSALLTSTSLNTIIGDNKKPEIANTAGFFVNGYLVPYEYYNEILNTENIKFWSHLNNYESNNLYSLADDYINLINQNNADKKILMGHSRGGAVVALANAIEKKSNNNNNYNYGCILIDPVDDSELSTINEIKSLKNNNRDNSRLNFSPTLIISTSWGGQSKYYNTKYESSCAPPKRAALAFIDAYKEIYQLSPQLLSFSQSSMFNDKSLIYVHLPEIGHLDILVQPPSLSPLTIRGVCATSPLIDKYTEKAYNSNVINRNNDKKLTNNINDSSYNGKRATIISDSSVLLSVRTFIRTLVDAFTMDLNEYYCLEQIKLGQLSNSLSSRTAESHEPFLATNTIDVLMDFQKYSAKGGNVAMDFTIYGLR